MSWNYIIPYCSVLFVFVYGQRGFMLPVWSPKGSECCDSSLVLPEIRSTAFSPSLCTAAIRLVPWPGKTRGGGTSAGRWSFSGAKWGCRHVCCSGGNLVPLSTATWKHLCSSVGLVNRKIWTLSNELWFKLLVILPSAAVKAGADKNYVKHIVYFYYSEWDMKEVCPSVVAQRAFLGCTAWQFLSTYMALASADLAHDSRAGAVAVAGSCQLVLPVLQVTPTGRSLLPRSR